MVVFMCEPNKAYCHQGIQNADRNYPAGRIDMDSIALQEPLPLSRVGYLEIDRTDYSTNRLALTNFLISKIGCKKYN